MVETNVHFSIRYPRCENRPEKSTVSHEVVLLHNIPFLFYLGMARSELVVYEGLLFPAHDS